MAECEAGNLISDAMRWVTGADIAFMNGGGIRNNLESSNDDLSVSEAVVFEMLPFMNDLYFTDVPGSTIIDVLEKSITRMLVCDDDADDDVVYADCANVLTGPKGLYMQVSGVKFEWSYCDEIPTLGSVYFQNGTDSYTALDRNATYKLAVSAYILEGGDDYDETSLPDYYDIAAAAGMTVGNAVSQYLANKTSSGNPYKGAQEGRIMQTTADAEATCSSGECTAGSYYSSSEGACTLCPIGRFASSTGSRSECTECAKGTHAGTEGMASCLACGTESYADYVGAESCDACPQRTTRIFAMLEDDYYGTSIDNCRCKEGSYRLDGSVGAACEQCPDGALCLGDLTLPFPRRGHWADLRKPKYLRSHPVCVDDGACHGGPWLISVADAGAWERPIS